MACKYCKKNERRIGKIQGFNAFLTEPNTVKEYEFGGYRFKISLNGAMAHIQFDVESKEDDGMFCSNVIDVNYCPMCGEKLGGDIND